LHSELNAQLIDYKTEINVINDKLTTEKSICIQINNVEEEWLSELAIPYNENDELEIISAGVFDIKGNILKKIKKKDIVTTSVISSGTFHEDNYDKNINLSSTKYPYQIKYRYKTTTDKFLYVCQWSPYLHSNLETKNASLAITLPNHYKVRIKPNNSAIKPTNFKDSEGTQHWNIKNLPPYNSHH